MDYSYLDAWFIEMMMKTDGRGGIFEYLYHPPFGKFDILSDLHGHTKTFSDGSRTLPFYKKTVIFCFLLNYIRK